MTTATVKAYGKINLTLDVGAKRPDGYHDIRSLMQTIALHDTLTLTHMPEVPGVTLEVVGGEGEGVPADESNLVHRAVVRLQKTAAALGRGAGNRSGLHVTLTKCIPSQAGLGGGSSDAAAALRGVNQLFSLGLSQARLAEIGAAIGADVPFFLTGGLALVEGLGERVTPQSPLSPPWPLIIVKPSAGVSTAAAYAALDAFTGRQPGSATEAWLDGNPRLGNDFEGVILPAYPAVRSAFLLIQTDQTNECFKPLLCGSGAALFCRQPTRDAAEHLAARIRAADAGKVWVTETVGGLE